MNDNKRLVRRIEGMPSNLLTEWERGFVFGAAGGAKGDPVFARLEAKWLAFVRSGGAVEGDLHEAA